MATAALVLGICSVVLCCTPLLGLAGGILAMVFAARVYNALKKGEAITGSRGMATAGLVLGIIGTVLSVIYNLVWLFAFLTISEWPRWFNDLNDLFH